MNSPNTDALTAIGNNARRLAEDARKLLKVKSHSSATAMAILSIEESGKYQIARWKLASPDWNPPPQKNWHIDKQRAFAAPFVAMVQIQTMCEMCKKHAGDDWLTASGSTDWEKSQDFLVEGYLVMQRSDNPTHRARALEIMNDIAKTIEDRIWAHPLACLMRLAEDGAISKEKNAALYVDVAKDGTVQSDPQQTEKGAAELWVDLARVGTASLVSYDLAEKAALKFLKQYRVTAPARATLPSSTTEDWRRMLEKLGMKLPEQSNA